MSAMLHDMGAPEGSPAPDPASCLPIESDAAIFLARRVDFDTVELAGRLRTYLSARKRRQAILPGGWFADPAWDLMLDLLASQWEGKPVRVSSACIAAGVPPTTGLRWIGRLVEEGAVIRHEDPGDGRCNHLTLAEPVATRLADWVITSLPCC